VLNLAISESFQTVDYANLQFPAQLLIDYVRVYQRKDVKSADSVSCDPKDYPTADYINRYATSSFSFSIKVTDLAS
jgi:beta-glucan synthesis-associated protein KRE6